MTIDIKVTAVGVIALCLALSAILYITSAAEPSLQGVGDRFFGLGVLLTVTVIILGIVGTKIRFP